MGKSKTGHFEFRIFIFFNEIFELVDFLGRGREFSQLIVLAYMRRLGFLPKNYRLDDAFRTAPSKRLLQIPPKR